MAIINSSYVLWCGVPLSCPVPPALCAEVTAERRSLQLSPLLPRPHAPCCLLFGTFSAMMVPGETCRPHPVKTLKLNFKISPNRTEKRIATVDANIFPIYIKSNLK